MIGREGRGRRSRRLRRRKRPRRRKRREEELVFEWNQNFASRRVKRAKGFAKGSLGTNE